MQISLCVKSTLAAMLISGAAVAQSVDGSHFRSIEEGTWYHPVEPDLWAYMGADEKTIHSVLTKIEQADGKRADEALPDTVMAYGPGNWVYEFVAAGEAAEAAGDYQAAVVYYHTAAAPHTGSEAQSEALEKARAAYAMAMQDIGTFEEVQIDYEGASFTAHLHIPEGEGPFPVLVLSNGSDMSSVAALGYYTKHLKPRGIAYLTLDLPGMGRSAAYDIKDGRSEKLIVAAAQWAKLDQRLSPENVFVQGVSFAGHSAARVFALHPELDLGGVIYTCGPLSAAFRAPPQAYAQFPKFTIDGVKTRLGLATDTDLETFAKAVRVMSVHDKGVFEGPKLDTPLLAINLNNDPSAPLEEMDALIARANHAERVVFDMPGHCPPHNQREPLVAAWVLENLR